ncbi:uncharacterized protein LOC142336659 [Convolutriloba macropyga]|uniref:uncharacterized protein LOC142336659 n=1 Tax=Convolutriloba macropyga TaxID=536237 RepID=UPI003F51B5F1
MTHFYATGRPDSGLSLKPEDCVAPAYEADVNAVAQLAWETKLLQKQLAKLIDAIEGEVKSSDGTQIDVTKQNEAVEKASVLEKASQQMTLRLQIASKLVHECKALEEKLSECGDYEQERRVRGRLKWLCSRIMNSVDAGLTQCEQAAQTIQTMKSNEINKLPNINRSPTSLISREHSTDPVRSSLSSPENHLGGKAQGKTGTPAVPPMSAKSVSFQPGAAMEGNISGNVIVNDDHLSLSSPENHLGGKAQGKTGTPAVPPMGAKSVSFQPGAAMEGNISGNVIVNHDHLSLSSPENHLGGKAQGKTGTPAVPPMSAKSVSFQPGAAMEGKRGGGDRDLDIVDLYWLEKHKRYSFHRNTQAMVAHDPNTLHNLGIAVCDSYVDTVDDSSQGLPPAPEIFSNMADFYDFERRALETLDGRVMRMCGKVWEGAQLACSTNPPNMLPPVTPSQTSLISIDHELLGNYSRCSTSVNDSNSQQVGIGHQHSRSSERSMKSSAVSSSLYRQGTPFSVRIERLHEKLLKLGKPTSDATPTVNPKDLPCLPLPIMKRNEVCPRLPTEWVTDIDIGVNNPQPKVVNQHKLYKETELKLFKPVAKSFTGGAAPINLKKQKLTIQKKTNIMKLPVPSKLISEQLDQNSPKDSKL